MVLKYEDWLKTQIKYKDTKCGVGGCDKPGLFEGGDVRCYFPICEEHGCMRRGYLSYLYGRKINIERAIDVEVAYQNELERKRILEERIQEVLNGDRKRT